MTRRDEVIRMADEAGIDYPFGEEMERFAALVAKAERERCANAGFYAATNGIEVAAAIRALGDEVSE